MRAKVLLLDDDDDVRAVMSDVLHLYFDRDSLELRSFDDMVSRGDDALTCNIAILDVNLGPGRPSGVDAHHWLRHRGFRGEIFFLTGHANFHPEVQRATAVGDAHVLRKPIRVEQLGKILTGEG
jgi:FixJ family two-component response regulator